MVLHRWGIMNRWYTIKAADVRGAADISIYEEIGGFGVTAKQRKT